MATTFVLIRFIWICYHVVRNTQSTFVEDVRNNRDSVCAVAELGYYRMENKIEAFLRKVENDDPFDNVQRYIVYIAERHKDRYAFDVEHLDQFETFTNKEELYFVAEYMATLYYSLAKKAPCNVETIEYEMVKWNGEKIVGPKACLIGINLRKIDYVYTLLLAEYSLLTSIYGKLQYSSILNFFLPEFSACWETDKFDVLIAIVSHMRNAAHDLRLKQTAAYFDENRLTLDHVISHLPQNELECIQPGHITGTNAFHRLIEDIEGNYMNTAHIFREPGAKGEPKMREILFAAVRNADNMQFILNGLGHDDPRFATSALKAFINVIKMSFVKDTPVASNPDDVTLDLIHRVHTKYHNHVCIEAMLFEFVRLCLDLTKNAHVNSLFAGRLSNMLGSIFDIDDVYTSECWDSTDGCFMLSAIQFFADNLRDHFDREVIDDYLRSLRRQGNSHVNVVGASVSAETVTGRSDPIAVNDVENAEYASVVGTSTVSGGYENLNNDRVGVNQGSPFERSSQTSTMSRHRLHTRDSKHVSNTPIEFSSPTTTTTLDGGIIYENFAPTTSSRRVTTYPSVIIHTLNSASSNKGDDSDDALLPSLDANDALSVDGDREEVSLRSENKSHPRPSTTSTSVVSSSRTVGEDNDRLIDAINTEHVSTASTSTIVVQSDSRSWRYIPASLSRGSVLEGKLLLSRNRRHSVGITSTRHASAGSNAPIGWYSCLAPVTEDDGDLNDESTSTTSSQRVTLCPSANLQAANSAIQRNEEAEDGDNTQLTTLNDHSYGVADTSSADGKSGVSVRPEDQSPRPQRPKRSISSKDSAGTVSDSDVSINEICAPGVDTDLLRRQQHKQHLDKARRRFFADMYRTSIKPTVGFTKADRRKSGWW